MLSKTLPWSLVVTVVVLFSSLARGEGTSAESKPELLAESLPTIKTWVPGEFPGDAPAGVDSGRVIARIVVDEQGVLTKARVLEATEPQFGEAALKAVKQWTFAPGVDYGRRAAMCVDIPFEFRRGERKKPGMLPPEHLMPRPVEKSSPSVIDSALGEYPMSLEGRGLEGRIVFSCQVDVEGRPSDVRVLGASHADLVLPALESSSTWKFTPAMNGDLPIAGEAKGEVFYTDPRAPGRANVLAANGISLADGANPGRAPGLVVVADPVFPHEALLAGEGGEATVEFTVGTTGFVRDVSVARASAPAFGESLVAAVETWVFEPALDNGSAVEVRLVKRAEFTAVSRDVTRDSTTPIERLVAVAREQAIAGGRGLDAKLAPVYRVPPMRPHSIPPDEKGEAVIEFVVDRDGRCRLPRVVSASKPEFGWAAATAVNQWVFKAPKRGGQPTEVSVKIPFTF